MKTACWIILLLSAGCSPGDRCRGPQLGGTCNAVDQCGCETGEICAIGGAISSCLPWEDCMPRGTGDLILQVGSTCDTDGPPFCRLGARCGCETGEEPPYHCYEMCLDDDDCSTPGSECTLELSLPGDTDWNPCPSSIPLAPYRLCTLP